MPFLFSITKYSVGGSEQYELDAMKKNYWLHRIKCGENAYPFTYELLENHNLISIGWSEFSRGNFPERLVASWDSFENVFDEEWGQHPRNRYCLWRFLKDMKKGDIVIVPMDYGYFRVYEIYDDIIYNNTNIDPDIIIDWNGDKGVMNTEGYFIDKNGNAIDMGFYRKVRPIFDKNMDIPRDGYATAALYSRMKIRQTNADISGLAVDVEEAIRRFGEHRPINIKQEFVKESTQLLLKQLQTLSHDQLTEQLVVWYMQELGGDIDCPSKNASSWEDGDVDVIAHFERLNDLDIYVQVKSHSNISGEDAVQQLERYFKANKDTLQEGKYQMWVISTCDRFCDEAIKRASELGIFLIDGPLFAKKLIENGVYSLPI